MRLVFLIRLIFFASASTTYVYASGSLIDLCARKLDQIGGIPAVVSDGVSILIQEFCDEFGAVSKPAEKKFCFEINKNFIKQIKNWSVPSKPFFDIKYFVSGNTETVSRLVFISPLISFVLGAVFSAKALDSMHHSASLASKLLAPVLLLIGSGALYKGINQFFPYENISLIQQILPQASFSVQDFSPMRLFLGKAARCYKREAVEAYSLGLTCLSLVLIGLEIDFAHALK